MISRRRLTGGATSVACPLGGVPLVAVALAFRGGAVDEPPELEGSTYVLHRLLTMGTAELSGARLAMAMEGLGGAVTAASDRDGFGLGATVLSDRLDTALRLISAAALEPGLRDADFEAVCAEAAAEIEHAGRSPQWLASRYLLPLLFPGHPYGRPPLASREVLARLTPEAVRARHREVCRDPSRVTLCLVGDFDAGRFAARAEALAVGMSARASARAGPAGGSALHEGAAPAPGGEAAPRSAPGVARPPAGGRVDVECPGATQSAVAVGFGAPRACDGDAVAMRVLSTALSMMGGRLWRVLREKPPHTYSVRAAHLSLAEAGGLVVHANVRPGEEDAVVAAVLGEASSIASRGLTEGEAARARAHLAGTIDISMERRAVRAAGYALAEVSGVGCESIERLSEAVRGVTVSDVARAAGRWLRPDAGYAAVTVRGRPS